MSYLVDTSVWARLAQLPVRQRVRSLSELYVCAPVVLEVGMTARGPNDHDRLMAVLAREATLVPTSAQVERDAIVAQRRLSEKGYHRAAKLADLLIAATAHAHGLVVLHYDSDYDLITESLGWETDWAVERGSVD